MAETGLPNEASSEMVVIHNNWSDNEEENESNQASSSGSHSKTLIDRGEVILVVEYLMKKLITPFENGRRQTSQKESTQQRKKMIPKRWKSELLLQPAQKVIKEIKERKKSDSEVD